MATKKELLATLADLNVEADPRSTKAQLEAMIAEHAAKEDEVKVVTMSKTLNAHKPKYRVDGVGGRLNNGDDVAKFLLDLDPFQTAELAERLLDCEPLWRGDGTAKYDHLNNGQIRMNSGNRIRAALKRGDITEDDIFGDDADDADEASNAMDAAEFAQIARENAMDAMGA